ncbi:hypothetical protein C8R42DRAFT_688796, partial [Lentinula raphanica]
MAADLRELNRVSHLDWAVFKSLALRCARFEGTGAVCAHCILGPIHSIRRFFTVLSHRWYYESDIMLYQCKNLQEN